LTHINNIVIIIIIIVSPWLARTGNTKNRTWVYFDSLYYCFVSFSTIGFGDLVASQHNYYPYVYLYRIGNWLLTLLGCCCVYSLFNVTSLVIKLFLNFLISKLNIPAPFYTYTRFPYT